jgi:glycosyltransferase involved in cell wall biosynthesis
VRVLVVNDLPPGGASGAEVHVELLVDGLRRGGDDVAVHTHGGGARRGLSRFADAWDPAARAELDRVVREWQPDVLHFHNVVRELSAAVLGAAPHLPRVLTAHDGRLLGDADGRGAALRLYQSRLRAPVDAAVARRRVDRVLAVSAPLADRLRAAGFPDVVHAPNWAAAPVAPTLPPELSQDVAFVGRLDHDKGVHLLVEAFEDAALDRPGARLLLAGAGPLAEPLRRTEAVQSGRVVLLGVLDRAGVSCLLGSARAVALASLPARRPEGAPLALVEGLVHGRPLLVSDDPGCAELAAGAGSGAAGLVVPAGDRRALADALRRLLADDVLTASLAAGARAAGERHGEQAGLAAVRAAYAHVLQGAAARVA